MYYDELVFIRISEERYNVQQVEFAASGSCPLAMWHVSQENIPGEYWEITPGTPTCFVCNIDGKDRVVGGGFFSRWIVSSVSDTWERFGIRTGSPTREDFEKCINERGGSDMLNIAVLSSCYMFTYSEFKELHEEFFAQYRDAQHFIMHTDDPCCRFLKKEMSRLRAHHLDPLGRDWPGLYYTASHHKSFGAAGVFYAKVMSAYNFTCAVTGTRAFGVLDVAHIKPIFSERFHSVRNGIVLRADLHRLFADGMITAKYEGPGEVVLKVSKSAVVSGAEDYMSFDGQRLQLPLKEKLWPDPDCLEWHSQHCFEHWLHNDGFHI